MFLKKLSGIIRSRCVNAKTTDASKTGAKTERSGGFCGGFLETARLDKVWVKFFKVDKARTREYGGSGIGLSIVKAIMDSFQQQCGCQNYDNGVAFWFTLEADGKTEEA